MWRDIRLHGFRSKFHKIPATALSVQTDIDSCCMIIHDYICFDPGGTNLN